MNVFLTVDTEASVGGAFADRSLKPVGNERRIFGRVSGGEWGIGPMMAIADSHGLKLTFFVEALASLHFGAAELEEVCGAILSRGHDVQLHLHPCFLNFGLDDPARRLFSDNIGTYPQARQAELLTQGLELLVKAGTPRPVAFRAGNHGIGSASLAALAQAGILLDSSYNAAVSPRLRIMPDLRVNDAARMPEGVVELPVTCFREATGLRPPKLKPLDINGVTFGEMACALERGRDMGLRNAVILMHSFSFIRTYDPQYGKVRIRHDVIARFEKLCRFLAGNAADFRTLTFGDLGKEDLSACLGPDPRAVPSMPARLSIGRLATLAMDALR